MILLTVSQKKVIKVKGSRGLWTVSLTIKTENKPLTIYKDKLKTILREACNFISEDLHNIKPPTVEKTAIIIYNRASALLKNEACYPITAKSIRIKESDNFEVLYENT